MEPLEDREALNGNLSNELRELLSQRINSFEKLELVMSLRAAPQFTSSIDALVERTRIPRDAVRSQLEELRSNSLVEVSEDSVRLAHSSEADKAAIAELERAYANDPIGIIKFISEVAMTRIRSMASQAFANAFILGKKKGGRDEDS